MPGVSQNLIKSYGVVWFYFLLFAALWPPLVLARDTGISGFNQQHYTPAVDSFGMWTVNSSQTLEPGQFYVLAESSVSGGQLNILNSGVLIKIFDQAVTTNLVVTLGVTNFASIGLDAPITPWLKTADFEIDEDVEDPVADEFRTWGIGDVRLFTKWRLLEGKIGRWWPGLGLLVYSTFPSGEENKFLGDTQPTVGGTFIIDKMFPALTVSVNGGVHVIQEKTVLGINIDDRLTFGAGIRVPSRVFNRPMELIADVSGHTMLQNSSTETTVIEYHVGIRQHFNNGLGISLAGGGSITNAVGNSDYRGIASLFWQTPSKSQRESVIQKPGQTTHEKTISTSISAPTPVASASPPESVIFFSLDATNLKSLDYQVIDNFIVEANAKPSSVVLIEATDNLGIDYTPGEKWVPYERLIAIRNALLSRGVDLNRIVISVSRDNVSLDISQGPVRMVVIDG